MTWPGHLTLNMMGSVTDTGTELGEETEAPATPPPPLTNAEKRAAWVVERWNGLLRAWDGVSDWSLRSVEQLVPVSIGLGALYVMWLLLGHVSALGGKKEQIEFLQSQLEKADAHWKGLLILTVPLFYRSMRIFIGRIRKGPFGIETQETAEVVLEAQKKTPLEGSQ